MKNTFFLLCASLLLSLTTTAQKKKSSASKVSVPEVVNSSFTARYAMVENNKWTKNLSGNYVANFTTEDQQKQTVEFDDQGKQLKIVTVYSETYPEVLSSAIAAKPKFAQSKITEASRIEIIGVDPYYLTYKAAELGYSSKVILAGRSTNDQMGAYVAKKVLQHIIQNNGNVRDAKVLIMGATFKENVSDIRNSKVADVVKSLKEYFLKVHIHDPYADSDELNHEYGFELTEKVDDDYDAVIMAVLHDDYVKLNDEYFASITKPAALIADLKGMYRNKISQRQYWSL